MGRADMSASSDVVWGIIRKNSSFLVKRNFLELSSEPGNLMNKNSFKYSGLANAEAVDIQDNEKGITFSRKIMKKTEGCNYRKDLKKPALARWYKIWKSQQA